MAFPCLDYSSNPPTKKNRIRLKQREWLFYIASIYISFWGVTAFHVKLYLRWRTVPPAAVTFWNAAFCSAASFPAGTFASWRMESAWKIMWTTKKYKSWWLYILRVLLPNYITEVNDNPLGIPISQWFFSPTRHEQTAFFQLRMMISTAYMSRRFACCFVEDLLDLLPPEG